MATTKTVLLDALDDLLEPEFKNFRWQLLNGGLTDKSIPRGKLENADRHDVVDLMVQHYGKPDAGKLAVRALRNIKQNDLADRLKGKLQEVSEDVPAGDGASSSGTAVAAQTAGVKMNINTSDGGSVKAPVLHGGVFNGPVTFN